MSKFVRGEGHIVVDPSVVTEPRYMLYGDMNAKYEHRIYYSSSAARTEPRRIGCHMLRIRLGLRPRFSWWLGVYGLEMLLV